MDTESTCLFHSPIVPSKKPTLQRVCACCKYDMRAKTWRETLHTLKTYVAAGVDIMAEMWCTTYQRRRPLLAHFIIQGNMEAVLACLESPNALQFSFYDFDELLVSEDSVLHAVAEANVGSSDYNLKVLEAVLERTQFHPEDEIQWNNLWKPGTQVYGNPDPVDFLWLVTQNQLLSVLWVSMREVTYFKTLRAEYPNGIPLTGILWEWDWNALSPELQQDFDVSGVTRWYRTTRATGKLWKLSDVNPQTISSNESTYLKEIERLVAEGADVMMFTLDDDRERDHPIMAKFVTSGFVEAAIICLKTPNQVNFTPTSICWERSVLHGIATLSTLIDEHFVRLLHAFLQRHSSHPEDEIHWEAEPLLCALAREQRLALSWGALQQETAYFGDLLEPVSIPVVWAWDWMALGDNTATFDVGRAAIIRADEYTGKLWRGSSAVIDSLDAQEWKELKNCLRNGADVWFRETPELSPPLDFVFKPVQWLRLILENSSINIDFTKHEYRRLPALHSIASRRKADIEEVLNLLVDRLARHPEDVIDWEQCLPHYYAPDALSLAAVNGNLKSWVNVLFHEKPVPCFTNRSSKILLHVPSAADIPDWHQLDPIDRERFMFESDLRL